MRKDKYYKLEGFTFIKNYHKIMNINQKRALYESIMREVGREVRKSLYEQRLSDYKESLNEGKVQQTIVAALAALQMFGGNDVKAAINWEGIDEPTKEAV